MGGRRDLHRLRSVPTVLAALLSLASLAIGCSSSSTSKAASANSSTSSAATASVKQGLALSLSGDLTGVTDPASTKVSRCSTINGQFFFEGTVSLGGTELSVKLNSGSDARIEISDVAADRKWSAPAAGDPAATLSVTPEAATSGSLTAVASTATPPTHITVQGTYAC